jgi:hypothetical protein
MKHLILCLIVMGGYSIFSFASEEGAENSGRFGPGKAIEAFDKEQGFKLSEKATIAMAVSFRRLDQGGLWRLPKESIVHLKQSTGVYRKFEGWISFVLVKVVKRERDALLVTSQDLEPGDEVAVQGAGFLRMTDADLNAGTVDSCAH